MSDGKSTGSTGSGSNSGPSTTASPKQVSIPLMQQKTLLASKEAMDIEQFQGKR